MKLNTDKFLGKIGNFWPPYPQLIVIFRNMSNNKSEDAYKVFWPLIQVNLFQKLLFLHQLIHNMATDCSLNYKFNTWKFQAQNMGRTCCVQKLFLTFRTIYVHNMFSLCSAKIGASDKDLSVLVCKAIVGFQISCVGLTLSVTLFLNTILCVAKISRNILFCQFQNWKLCD